MPSIADWKKALLFPRSVYVKSDAAIARAVNARPKSKSFSGTPKNASEVALFSPPKELKLTAGELLRCMGRITVPKIDNLADVCSTWARIRYIWAFDSSRRAPPRARIPLCLSQEAREIDFHQKTLLSDEVGVGMAALVMERFFSAVDAVDVDVALRKGRFARLVRSRTGDPSPDYIFEAQGQSYFVVECKGTQTGSNTVLTQLKRGTEQLPGVRFQSSQVPAYVIGTWLAQFGTEVYIVDPPGLTQDHHQEEEENYDLEQFMHRVEVLQQAGFLRYIGAFGEANLLEQSIGLPAYRYSMPARPTVRLKIPGLEDEYVGVSLQAQLPGEHGQVHIFQGAPITLYTYILEHGYRSAKPLAASYFDRITDLAQQSPPAFHLGDGRSQEDSWARDSTYTFEEQEDALSVNFFGRDATLLRIEIS